MFIGEGEYEYNLDALTEIEVTDPFLGLEEATRECQLEPFYNCTTRHYLQSVQDECGCLPLNIRFSNKVSRIVDICIISINLLFVRHHSAIQRTSNVSAI